VLLDTPGLRELEPWDADRGLREAFADVDALATGCRFTDCAHRTEPDCAVLAAVEAGELLEERLEAYQGLAEAQATQASRMQALARVESTRRARRAGAETPLRRGAGEPG
jgi:ribosome biogenesis GTPase